MALKYPETSKQNKLQRIIPTIERFFEWLAEEKGIAVVSEDEPDVPLPITQLIAWLDEYGGIDRRAIDDEQDNREEARELYSELIVQRDKLENKHGYRESWHKDKTQASTSSEAEGEAPEETTLSAQSV